MREVAADMSCRRTCVVGGGLLSYASGLLPPGLENQRNVPRSVLEAYVRRIEDAIKKSLVFCLLDRFDDANSCLKHLLGHDNCDPRTRLAAYLLLILSAKDAARRTVKDLLKRFDNERGDLDLPEWTEILREKLGTPFPDA